MNVVKGTFSLDGIEGTFKGWTSERTWNGWEMPLFELDEALKIVEAFVEEGYYAVYDESENVIYINTSDDTADVELMEVCDCVFRVDDDGNALELFDIGAGSWTWWKDKSGW